MIHYCWHTKASRCEVLVRIAPAVVLVYVVLVVGIAAPDVVEVALIVALALVIVLVLEDAMEDAMTAAPLDVVHAVAVLLTVGAVAARTVGA